MKACGQAALLTAVLGLSAAWAQGGAPAYTVTPLPTGPLAAKPPGPASAYYAEPLGLNDGGLVAGAVRSPEATPFACLWEGGKIRAVPGALKPGALATAVGPHGEVAGQVTEADGEHAYLTAAGKLSRLPKLAGCEREWASAVNARGEVCGFAFTAEGQPHACLWPKGAGSAVDLHALVKKALPAAVGSRAFGVNDRGDVVGEAEDEDGRTRAFHYTGGKVVLLAVPGSRESGAAALNNGGQIAGWANLGAGDHLFLFQGGKATDLGVLPRYRDMLPTAINARGEIVGYADSDNSEARERGWLWRGGKLYDLTALLAPGSGYTVGIVRGINTRGQIAGSAVRGSRVEGVLLTPR